MSSRGSIPSASPRPRAVVITCSELAIALPQRLPARGERNEKLLDRRGREAALEQLYAEPSGELLRAVASSEDAIAVREQEAEVPGVVVFDVVMPAVVVRRDEQPAEGTELVVGVDVVGGHDEEHQGARAEGTVEADS